MLQWELIQHNERLCWKVACEQDLATFTKFFFQVINGQKMLWNWHHQMFVDILTDIYNGYARRVIVNCPPGSTKTMLFSIYWPAWCIVQNISKGLPSRWLPLSYSSELVDENSVMLKDILKSEAFQWMWPLEQSKEASAKSNWKFTDSNNNEHKLYGTSLAGQVTGRRAGFMEGAGTDNPPFTGALILDDPLPPREEGFGRKIEKYNKFINRVVRSRLAHDDIPIIMVQQRIAKNDTTAYMMSDAVPDSYERYIVPALIDSTYLNKLDRDTAKLAIKATGYQGERCSYWPIKEPTETLFQVEKADPYLMASQYQQSPDDAFLEGVIYRRELELMIAENRVGHVPVERHLPTYTFWDLGYSDNTCIWVAQKKDTEIRLVACYVDNEKSFAEYANWLLGFKDTYGVHFNAHYGPHDLAQHEFINGKSRIEQAKSLGIRFKLVKRVKDKRESIEALRSLFPRFRIDNNRCAKGIDSMRKYRRTWDADNEVFSRLPVHDKHSDVMDALQQLGLAWKDEDETRQTIMVDEFIAMDSAVGW